MQKMIIHCTFFSEIGRLMARYCVAFESMKRFLGLKGNETLSDLVSTYRHTHNHYSLHSDGIYYGLINLYNCLRWKSCLCVRSLPMWDWEWMRREFSIVSIKTKISLPSGKAVTFKLLFSVDDEDDIHVHVGFLWMARLSQQTWKWTGINKINIKVLFCVITFYSSQLDPSCSRLSAYTGVCSQSGHSGSNFILHRLLCSRISFPLCPSPLPPLPSTCRKSSVLPIDYPSVSLSYSSRLYSFIPRLFQIFQHAALKSW